MRLLNEQEINKILNECDYSQASNRHNIEEPDIYVEVAKAQQRLDIEDIRTIIQDTFVKHLPMPVSEKIDRHKIVEVYNEILEQLKESE